MAIIKFGEKEVEIQDGQKIQEVCEEEGIPFGCKNGLCGTCRIEIEEGAENLSPVNEKERDLSADTNNRYACQCTIKSGTVKIKQ